MLYGGPRVPKLFFSILLLFNFLFCSIYYYFFGFIFQNIIISIFLQEKSKQSKMVFVIKNTAIKCNFWNLQWNLQQTYKPTTIVCQLGRQNFVKYWKVIKIIMITSVGSEMTLTLMVKVILHIYIYIYTIIKVINNNNISLHCVWWRLTNHQMVYNSCFIP